MNSHCIFLKLNKLIINTNTIKSIAISNSQYHINFINQNITGFIIYGSGNIESHENSITICEKNNPQDYKIVSNWINLTCYDYPINNKLT